MNGKGFTLIELLIVIAIIAILALIAIPNFLEAQTRAKTSRAKADLRSSAIAIEAYYVDWNAYLRQTPYSYGFYAAINGNGHKTFERLTTPVSYITGVASFTDPFGFPPSGNISSSGNAWREPQATLPPADANEKLAMSSYYYSAREEHSTAAWNDTNPNPAIMWTLQSKGPDRVSYALGNAMYYALSAPPAALAQASANSADCIYDPSNGTISRGSIFRVGGMKPAEGEIFFTMVCKGQ